MEQLGALSIVGTILVILFVLAAIMVPFCIVAISARVRSIDLQLGQLLDLLERNNLKDIA